MDRTESRRLQGSSDMTDITTEQMIEWAEQEARRATVGTVTVMNAYDRTMWGRNADIAKAVADRLRQTPTQPATATPEGPDGSRVG